MCTFACLRGPFTGLLFMLGYLAPKAQKPEEFFLGSDDGERLAGKRVVVVDDVISSGGSIVCMMDMIKQCGGIYAGSMCAFTEDGVPDCLKAEGLPPVVALDDLPFNDPAW